MKTRRIWAPNSASRLAKRGFNRFAKHVRPLVGNLRDYLFAEMDYAPEGWSGNASIANSWSDQTIADAQERHWPTLVQNLAGTGPLGVAHFPWSQTREDRTHHNVMMSYGYVLARTARNKHSLSILDWGGGAGHYYLYSKALLPEVVFDYHCFDVCALCDAGRKLLPEAHFYSDEAGLRGKMFDLVISSSSLHYFENWRQAARKLACASRDFLYVARLQTVFSAPSFVAVHNLNRGGYSQFLSWCLNRQELVSCLEGVGMQLVREFVYANSWAVRGAPEKAETRGFLFRRQSSLPGLQAASETEAPRDDEL
jgi:putative methyltransferase (TIGR04325 family)